MKKKFYGALLLGSVLLTGGMVSCSDYDDDINSLNDRVAAVEETVKGLQEKINAGCVITSVDPTENGVKVTLSNGESFELLNGAPGAAATVKLERMETGLSMVKTQASHLEVKRVNKENLEIVEQQLLVSTTNPEKMDIGLKLQ